MLESCMTMFLLLTHNWLCQDRKITQSSSSFKQKHHFYLTSSPISWKYGERVRTVRYAPHLCTKIVSFISCNGTQLSKPYTMKSCWIQHFIASFSPLAHPSKQNPTFSTPCNGPIISSFSPGRRRHPLITSVISPNPVWCLWFNLLKSILGVGTSNYPFPALSFHPF